MKATSAELLQGNGGAERTAGVLEISPRAKVPVRNNHLVLQDRK